MRIGLLAAVLAAPGCFHAARGRSASNTTGQQVVQDFVSGFGVRRSSALVGLFTEDATVRIEGLGVALRGRDEVRQLVEYGAIVHSRMRMLESAQDSNVVTGRVEEKNDWFDLLGVPKAYYTGRFTFTGARVSTARIELEPATQDALGSRLAEFVVWLAANEPKALSRVLPGGRLALDADVFQEILSLLRRWRSGRR
jgi:hypothetical protein